MLSQFSAAAIVCAADASFHDLKDQAAHRVQKMYYMVDTQAVVNFDNEAFGGINIDVDGVTRKHVGWPDWEIMTQINAEPYIRTVQKAVQCHKSQLPG